MPEKMLITKGLAELKTLEKRILSKINEAEFVSAAKTSHTNISPDLTKKQFEDNAKADLASIIALIERRAKIKSAIMKQNTITKVYIGGREYTVAEAVDLKNTIRFQKELLYKLQSQFTKYSNTVDQQNQAVERKIDDLIKTALGNEAKSNSKTSYPLIEEYMKSNEYSLVDPIKAKNKIDELSKFIDDFTNEVDIQLQISNCNTEITID